MGNKVTFPPDDPNRALVVVNPDEPGLPHLGLAGDTYTVLLSGKDTAGRYCLIDMHVPPGGGPGPHRHDFEESFIVLAGAIEVSFRGQTTTVRMGQTASIPANAAHEFNNVASHPARLLCICSPAGQDAFFEAIGVSVASRTTPPPNADPVEQAALRPKAEELAPQYQTELL